jgi:hypothetical protein
MKSGPHKILAVFNLLVALALVIGFRIPHARDPLPVAAISTSGTAARGSAFPLSIRGTAIAMLTTDAFAPPTAPVLGLVMADFTGDTHPDSATVEFDRFDSANVHYWIEIQLTEGGRQFLRLTAPFGGLRITPKDVTGDGNLDLIVRAANSQALLAVYLNDGSGHFSPAEPAAFATKVQEASSDFGFTTQHPYFGVASVCTESDAIECRSTSLRNRQAQNDFHLRANHIARPYSVLSFVSNRAPPTFIAGV